MSSENHSFVNNSGGNSSTGEPDGSITVAVGLLGAIYAFIFLLALVGNILALLTCCKNYRVTTSILLVYIASLASADLLFTVLSTFDVLAFVRGEWIGGDPMCKIQGFLIETSYSVSILTLAAISYERFRSISSKRLARSKRIETRTIIVKMAWLLSVVLCAPVLYGYAANRDNKSEKLVCVNNLSWGDTGRQAYYALQAVFLFLLPLGIMVWAHFRIFRVLELHSKGGNTTSSTSNKQRKVTKMLAVVTLTFFCCWTPFIIIRALRYFGVYNGDIPWKLSQLLILLNSGINPILYCFFSGQFRSSFKAFMRCNCKQIVVEKDAQERSFGSNTFHATRDPKRTLSRSASPLQSSGNASTLSLKTKKGSL